MENRNDWEKVLQGGRVLLPGMPGTTDRGFLGFCTVILFRLDGEWWLYDTGQYNDRHLLVDALTGAGVAPGDIRRIILSHLHFDHVLNLPLFPDATVWVSRQELDHADRVAAGQARDPVLVDRPRDLLAGHALVTVDGAMDLSGGARLEVVPGHTPGGLVLHFPGPPRVTISGDAIKNAWEAVTGEAAMTVCSAETTSEGIRSLTRRAEILVPGHDRPFRLGGPEPEYLDDLALTVRMHVYPAPRNHPYLEFRSPAGPSGGGVRTTAI